MDWREITDDKEKYAAYLCSREWAEKREAVRERADGKCERCLIMPMEACHHLTYKRKYNESLGDLQAICTPCHEFTHGKSAVDPRGFVRSAVIEPGCSPVEGASLLRCPVCDFDFVHINSVTTDRKIKRWRGNVIVFHCECEEGHSFEMCFASHKGNVFCYTQEHRNAGRD